MYRHLHTDAIPQMLYSLPVLIGSSEVKFSESMCKALTNSDGDLLSTHSRATQANNMWMKHTQKGMTLLEMLVALAVVAIVLTVVAPNVQTIVAKNRTTSEINELSGIIQFARFTAIDQSSTAIVCPSANYASCGTNWNLPKIVFVDNNANNVRDTSEPLLMSTTAITSNNSMTGPASPIVFYDSGAANDSASIKICPNNNDAKLARSINVNAQGRVRVSVDSNNNDIFEDTEGDELSCS